MPDVHRPTQNHLLAAMLRAEPERLQPHLEWVDMLSGDMLYRSGDILQHVYFPTTAVVSLHYVLANGDSSEVASVGNEGMLGIALFMGSDVTPSHAVVQRSGHGYRLAASLLMQEWNRAGVVMRLLLRYTQAQIAQISQVVACKRHHSLEQRLCRCLLLMLDRSSNGELCVPQKSISGMLDVRRENLVAAVAKLHSQAYIEFHRGYLTVLDRAGLESKTCSCYTAIKAENALLLADLGAR